jgi:hypothetical protein
MALRSYQVELLASIQRFLDERDQFGYCAAIAFLPVGVGIEPIIASTVRHFVLANNDSSAECVTIVCEAERVDFMRSILSMNPEHVLYRVRVSSVQQTLATLQRGQLQWSKSSMIVLDEGTSSGPRDCESSINSISFEFLQLWICLRIHLLHKSCGITITRCP